MATTMTDARREDETRALLEAAAGVISRFVARRPAAEAATIGQAIEVGELETEVHVELQRGGFMIRAFLTCPTAGQRVELGVGGARPCGGRSRIEEKTLDRVSRRPHPLLGAPRSSS